VALIGWHSRNVLAWRVSSTMYPDFCVVALKGCSQDVSKSWSDNLYGLIETTKANGLEYCHYLRYLYKELPMAEIMERMDGLLTFNEIMKNLIDATIQKRWAVKHALIKLQ